MYPNSTLKLYRKLPVLIAMVTAMLCSNNSTYAQNCNADFTNGIPATNITASSENPPSEDRTKAFDNLVTTKWLALATTGSLTVNLVTPKLVSAYSITSANDVPTRDPKNWVIEGSNDGTVFTPLDSRTGITFESRYQTLNFSFSNTTAYQYYRIRITANNGSAASLQLAEIQLLPNSTCVQTTIPCATTELFADTRFLFPQASGSNVSVDNLSSNGWTGSGDGVATISSSYTYLYENSYTQIFTHSFTGVNPSGAGAIVTMSAGVRNGIEGMPAIVDWGEASVLTIKYGGVAYATVTTDNLTASDGHIATINYLGGASGSLPNGYNFDYGPSPQGWDIMDLTDWQIFLPASIPTTGDLVLEFNPGGSSTTDAADDFNIGSVSLKACHISISGNVFNDIDALSDNVVDNNGGAQPASTLPAGITANLFNATTGSFDATVPVTNGAYTFRDIKVNTNYKVIISKTAATAGKTATTFPSLLPAGWVNTGDVNPTDPIATELTPGISSVIEIAASIMNEVNFGIADLTATVPLPVTLVNFTGIAPDCHTAALNWQVSDVVNFSHFEIERSMNGIDFRKTAAVLFNASISHYSFSENVFDKGSYQYRLKMIDADGKNTYSPIVLIKPDCNQQREISVYPNPVRNTLTIEGLKSGEQMIMYNASGQVVKSQWGTGSRINVDMLSLLDGIYYIIVKNNNGVRLSDSKIAKTH